MFFIEGKKSKQNRWIIIAKKRKSRVGHSASWVRSTRKSQGLKPYTKEQLNLTSDQRHFLANHYMGSGGKLAYKTVYGYGGGRPINKKVIDPLVKRKLIVAKNWKKQKYSDNKQVDVKLTEKGKIFGKAFYF